MTKEHESKSVEEYFEEERKAEILMNEKYEEVRSDKRLRRRCESPFMLGGLWTTFLHPQAEPAAIEFPDLPGWEELNLNDRALLIEVLQVVYLQIIDHDDLERQRAGVLHGLRGRKTQLSAKKLSALLRVFSLASNQEAS